jgi:hypothetical protein
MKSRATCTTPEMRDREERYRRCCTLPNYRTLGYAMKLRYVVRYVVIREMGADEAHMRIAGMLSEERWWDDGCADVHSETGMRRAWDSCNRQAAGVRLTGFREHSALPVERPWSRTASHQERAPREGQPAAKGRSTARHLGAVTHSERPQICRRASAACYAMRAAGGMTGKLLKCRAMDAIELR